MGNRAVIVNVNDMRPEATCVYLHWNGGKDSVSAFLKAARELGVEGGLPAFAEMLAERFFECKVGINIYVEEYGRADCDNGDNGVYIIDDNFELVGRIFGQIREQEDFDKYQEILNHLINWNKAA